MTPTPISTEGLWELLSHKLRSFFARRVADEQIADDLLQETFLRIHQGLGRIDDEQRIHAWVFQIARNLLIDHQRSRPGASPSDDSTPLDRPAAEGDDNLNDLVRSWLPVMITQLPEPYRRAVALYELDGLPQQQIADQLGISLSGAKSRIQRGREKLKAALFDCCSFERDRRGNIIAYARRSPRSCGSRDDDAVPPNGEACSPS